MTRKLTLPIFQIISDFVRPDTELTVTIYTDAVSPVLVTTAVETPAGSGQYLASWTTQTKYGYWYVSGIKRDDLGRIWLGEDGQTRPTFIFRKVEVYDSADSPSGAKNSARTFTTGSGALATDSDGNTSWTFTTIPIVAIAGKYQERGAFISTDPTLTGGNATFGISAEDMGDNYSDGKTYVDIVIISRD